MAKHIRVTTTSLSTAAHSISQASGQVRSAFSALAAADEAPADCDPSAAGACADMLERWQNQLRWLAGVTADLAAETEHAAGAYEHTEASIVANGRPRQPRR